MVCGYIMQITWQSCAEQMPPDDETIIICIYGGGMIDKMRADVFHCACKFSQKVNGETSIIWSEFTREKWEYLNGIQIDKSDNGNVIKAGRAA